MSEEIEVKWFGTAGHLCVSTYCRFHLTTKVGTALVSTVGEYFPGEGTRELLARSRGILLEGVGDTREADYMKKIGYEEIGFGRLFETMVFDAGPPCECGCGLPTTSGECLDMEPYNTAADANAGHIAMVEKWRQQQI